MQIILKNHWAIYKIVDDLNISVGSVETIINSPLKYSQVSVRWRPTSLLVKRQIVWLLYHCFWNMISCKEIIYFSEKTLTCYEIKVHHFTPDRKRTNMWWIHKEWCRYRDVQMSRDRSWIQNITVNHVSGKLWKTHNHVGIQWRFY